MSDRNFCKLLEKQWSCGNFVCVGLDPDIWQIPTEHIPHSKYMNPAKVMFVFNTRIINTTWDLACAYKPNIAFYEAYGNEGLQALHKTIMYINRVAPGVPVILDAKRGDIGKSNVGYVKMAFDFMEADAITVSPYLGAETLEPFLAKKDKGIFVLCRTSNPGGDEFQRISFAAPKEEGEFLRDRCGTFLYGFDGGYIRLYEHVAYRVSQFWNKNGNCGLVVGAICPEELGKVRGIVGDMPILIPGVGAQDGDVEKTVLAGKNNNKQGMIINSSSGIIYASKNKNFAEAARRETEKLRDLINQYRQKGA